ncbi:ferrous iron transport protein A [Candidatus Sumerlaeota bacterium]|nr:ferrous iron transport protein A [Candidatus Sumerlaeota bacterium]
MKRGQVGVVDHVEGSPEFVRRLGEMGIHVGGILEVLDPGVPCRLAVGSSRIALRGELLHTIRVCPLT